MLPLPKIVQKINLGGEKQKPEPVSFAQQVSMMIEKQDKQKTTRQISPKPVSVVAEETKDKENELMEALPHFLRKENIKDAKGRRPEHPEYDCTTLFIPDSAWSSFSGSML